MKLLLPLVSIAIALFAAAGAQRAAAQEARERWIVRLDEAPLARYAGGVPGLAATRARAHGRTRLDPHSAPSRAYLRFLDERQERVRAAIDQQCGRSVPVERRFRAALNGLVVRLDAGEVTRVRGIPGVRDVVPDIADPLDTDRGPLLIEADEVWPGGGTGVDTQGEGVVIGILDTGINGAHPSFAEVGPVDGHVHTNPLGSGVFLGRCALPPAHTDYYPHCNDKLIGAYSYSTDDDPEDDDGHGSHVSGTAAGNAIQVTWPFTLTANPGLVFDVSGVAPHANLVMYEVCAATCFSSARVAAVDQAILDGVVDVLNHSISLSLNPWTHPVAEAFLNAAEAGIFVSVSAGNDGPGAATVSSGAPPWAATVANSSHDRVFRNHITGLTASGGHPDIEGLSESAGTGGPFEIVYAGDVDVGGTTYPLCATGTPVFPPDGSSNPFPPGTFTGQIVICDRGIYARVEKGFNVDLGGAAGYVLANAASDGNSLVADDHYLPSTHITHDDGVSLKAWLGAGGPAFTGEITDGAPEGDASFADIMTASSSRGPHPNTPEVLVPDLAAPGASIIAAYTAGSGGDEVAFLTGTSMASPHVAGSAALLRAAHPNWTPPEIKSALMLGARPVGTKEDAVTPSDPFDRGAGRVDVSRAVRALLVLDETVEAYEAADPALGGDPTTLNLASLAHPDCRGICTFTRVVRNVSGGSVVADVVQTAGDPGLLVDVTPSQISLATGAAAPLEITVDTIGACPGSPCNSPWLFGRVEFQIVSSPLGAGADLDLGMPVAVLPAVPEVPLEIVGVGLSGTIEVVVAGIPISVGTSPGDTPSSVAAALAALINANPTLSGLGIGASATGSTLTVTGSADAVAGEVTDPGLGLGSLPSGSIREIGSLSGPHSIVDFGGLPLGPTTPAAVASAYPGAGLAGLAFLEAGLAGTTTYASATAGGRALKPNASGGLELLDPFQSSPGEARAFVVRLHQPILRFGIAVGANGGMLDKVTLFRGAAPVALGGGPSQDGTLHFLESSVAFDRILIEEPESWVVAALALETTTLVPALAPPALSALAVLLLGAGTWLLRRPRHQ